MSDLRSEELLSHTRFLRRLALHLVRDPHAADDLTQETLAAALAAPRPPREGLRAWLGGVLRNRARMRWRGEARRARREQESAPAEAVASPVEMAARLETQEAVVRAVRALPEPFRTTIFLRFLDGRSTADVARLTGVPASTVRSRQQRALALLRERLDRERGGRAAWCAALIPLFAGRKSFAAGVLVVSAKKALVVVLLAVAGLLWFANRPETPDSRRSADGPVAPTERPAPAPSEPPAKESTPPDRDRDLFGEVVDAAGAPVEGARVAAVIHPLRRSALLVAKPPRIDGPATRSATDGTFRIRLERGAEVDLAVTAAGFPEVTVPRCQAGERVRIVLHPAATLRVVVRDHDGRPVAGVPLRLEREPAGSQPVWIRRAKTDAGGVVVFRDGTPGAARLFGAGVHDCTLPGSIEVTYPAARRLTGTVRDAATGAPIAGARVGANWWFGDAVETDRSGRFAFERWRGDGAREVHVEAAGFGRAARVAPAEGELDFELTGADEAAGRVVDAEGRPVAGAHLVAMASRHTDEMQHVDVRRGRTDDDGRFLLRDLRHDLPHTLIVEAAGHGRRLVDFLPRPVRPGRIELGEIELPVPLRVEGRVVDGAGAPIAGKRVTLTLEEEHVVGSFYGVTLTRRTDDLGRFRFRDIGAARYTIAVPLDGRVSVERTLDVREDVTGVVLAVTAGRTVTVRVLDEEGTPLAGMMVDAGKPNAETGADGRVTLEQVDPGETVVKVWPPRARPADERGYRPGEAPLRDDGGEIEVRLRTTHPLRGRVIGPDDSPQARLVVAAVRPADGAVLAQALADEAGRFAVFLERGQAVDLVADGSRQAGGHAHGPIDTVDVYGRVEGVTAPASGLTLRVGAMPHDRALTVVVLDPAGEPVAGAEVRFLNARAFPYPDPTARTIPTDSRGRVTVADLARRRVRLTASGGALEAVVPPPVVAWPEGQTIVLRYERGEPIQGTVLRARGSPAAGAKVRLLTMSGNAVATVTTDEAGRFRVLARTGQKHQVHVELDAGNDLAYRAHRYDVTPGETIELTLTDVAR